MVLEITDPAALSGTALESIAAEFGEPGGEAAEERMLAEAAVREDGAEALASLIDPFDLVSEVPGSNSPTRPGAARASITTRPIRTPGTSTRRTKRTTKRTKRAPRTKITKRGPPTASRTMGWTTASTAA